MSVMTGRMFADICYFLWGDSWKKHAAEHLGIKERQLRYIEIGQSNVSRRHRVKLCAIIREHREILSAFEQQLAP